MKWKKLFDSHIPQYKCGASVVADTVLGGVGLLTNTISGASTNAYNSHNQWEMAYFNAQEAQKNRDFQAEEAEKQRQYGTEEWQRQFDAQRKEWYNQLKAQYGAQWEQFMQQAEYNSPANQAQRLRQAGVNPAALLSGTNSGGLVSAASAVPMASPSVPSGGSIPSNGLPTGSVAQGSINVGANNPLSQVGSFIRDLSEAYKNNHMLEPLVAESRARAIKFIAEKDAQNLLAAGYELDNYVKSKTKDAKVKKAFEDLNNVIADTMCKAAMGESYDSQVVLNAAKTALAWAQSDKTMSEDKQLQFWISKLPEQFEVWKNTQKSEQEKNRADSAVAYSLRDLNNSKKLTEDLIRTPKVWAQQIANSIARGTMTLQEVNIALSKVHLSIEEKKKVVAELEEERAKSVREMRDEEPSFKLFDDIAYSLGRIFNVSLSN